MFIFRRAAAAAVTVSLVLVGLVVADFYTTWPNLQQLERVTAALWILSVNLVLVIRLYQRLKHHVTAVIDARLRTATNLMLEAAGNTRVEVQYGLLEVHHRLTETIESAVDDLTDLIRAHGDARAAEAVLADRRRAASHSKPSLILGEAATVHHLHGPAAASPHPPPPAAG